MSRLYLLIITMLAVSLLWVVLELFIYGEVQPRKVDDIMWLVWGVSLVMAYKEGESK